MEIGIWSAGFRYSELAVSVEDGVLRVESPHGEQRRWYGYGNCLPFKREFGARYFGDERWLIGVDSDFVNKLILECKDKTEEEVVGICEKYRSQREARKTEIAKSWEKWQRLREKFDGVVIGIDGKVDVYGDGFSVRVLFDSGVSFQEKRKFLAENRVEFLKWVMHELSENKMARRKIGDMKFYKPVEIINLRSSEVEVKFEVKREVA